MENSKAGENVVPKEGRLLFYVGPLGTQLQYSGI